MTGPASFPLHAHAALIERIFDQQQAWQRIERRLRMYPSIAKHFDLDMMRAAQGTRPFHAHYMAWRLGTWRNERNFEVLDGLLQHAASLPDWEKEASLLTSTDFGVYWALVWQLQVAARLARVGKDVCWLGGHCPDLRVQVDGKPLFVECYSFQKRFGLLAFIEELSRWVDEDITIERNLAFPISFGRDQSGRPRSNEDFLHDLFQGLQQEGVLDSARARARVRSPVDLPMPVGTNNLALVMNGPGQRVLSLGRNSSGEPEHFLDHVVSEVLRSKTGQNALAAMRPNVVAVSQLVGPDYQISRSLRPNYVPSAHLPDDIDALALSVTSIDASVAEFQHGYFRPGHQLVLDVLGIPAAAQHSSQTKTQEP